MSTIIVGVRLRGGCPVIVVPRGLSAPLEDLFGQAILARAVSRAH